MPLVPDVAAYRAMMQARGRELERELEREIVAAGKTTGQLEREIATLLPERDRPPEVFVILVSSRSREELRRDFDDALSERP
jgi:hypothetical protein